MGKVLLFKPSTHSGSSYGAAMTRMPTEPNYPPRPTFPAGTPLRFRTFVLKEWTAKVAAMKAQYEADLAAWQAQNQPATSSSPWRPSTGFETTGPVAPGTSVPFETSALEEPGAEVVDLFEEPTGIVSLLSPYKTHLLWAGGLTLAYLVISRIAQRG